MDKGIRPAAIAKFNELLPTRVNTREGNTAFRKTVMASIMEDFGITLASAATHYNHAFMEAKKDPAKAELLVGLGRPDDKKGGRKKVAKPAAAPAATDTATVGDVLSSSILSSGTEVPQPTITDAAAQVGIEQPADEAPKGEEPAADETPVQKYSVRKVSDKSIVCSDLTLEEANALIAKAAAAKKAKLELAD